MPLIILLLKKGKNENQKNFNEKIKLAHWSVPYEYEIDLRMNFESKFISPLVCTFWSRVDIRPVKKFLVHWSIPHECGVDR